MYGGLQRLYGDMRYGLCKQLDVCVEEKGGVLWRFVIHVPAYAAAHVVLRAHPAAVAVKVVVVLVLRVRDAAGADQDVQMCAMDVVDVWGALQLVWRVASINVTDLVQDFATVVVQVALVVVVVAVAAAVPVHAEDVRPAVHVQTYVQEDALAHAMQAAATAVRHLVCHRVRVHALRLAQGSRRYQLLLIKGRYKYENQIKGRNGI